MNFKICSSKADERIEIVQRAAGWCDAVEAEV